MGANILADYAACPSAAASCLPLCSGSLRLSFVFFPFSSLQLTPLPRLLPPPTVALVLGFVGAKILADYGGYHVPTDASLAVVAGILALGIGASVALPREPAAEEEQ